MSRILSKIIEYKKRYVVFDDVYSVIHSIIAFSSVILNVSLEATLCYLLYQYLDRGDTDYEKAGDVVEWIVGLILGAITKFILPYI